ncbi:uncharacterized protein LOC112565987 [Pomacea canaliculata]|uniref:uncharacterized protein LOC112565987 n=1 Tax=Pomacea canaliculata TaxID=400727 RepID=UPI000D72D54D|nr:uncharacterized protein LOC112565987 [Pomacea canaliculata]XP_025097685.1 uncharacterized protein LOC112565987 [Pomacea canaliculata]
MERGLSNKTAFKNHSCEKCGAKMKNPSTLRRHMKRHHPSTLGHEALLKRLDNCTTNKNHPSTSTLAASPTSPLTPLALAASVSKTSPSTTKRKYPHVGFSEDPILLERKMIKTTAQAPQCRVDPNEMVIVPSTTEEELTSPEKFGVKSGSELDTPLMISLVGSYRLCHKVKGAQDERTSTVESSETLVSDEDCIIPDTSSQESDVASELENMVEIRMSESEGSEFKGIKARWVKEGEDVSSTDCEDDKEHSCLYLKQTSDTHQEKTSEEEEFELPKLNLPSRRLSLAKSSHQSTGVHDTQDVGRVEQRISQKETSRHPPKNLRKRPRDAIWHGKNECGRYSSSNNSEESIESCCSGDDDVESRKKELHSGFDQLELSRALHERSKKSRGNSDADISFLRDHGAQIKTQTSQCQFTSAQKGQLSNTDQPKSTNEAAYKRLEEECPSTKIATKEAALRESSFTILCYPLAAGRSLADFSGKVSDTNSHELKDSTNMSETDTATGLQSPHSLSGFDDMTQPCDEVDKVASSLAAQPMEDFSKSRKKILQGQQSDDGVDHMMKAKSGKENCVEQKQQHFEKSIMDSIGLEEAAEQDSDSSRSELLFGEPSDEEQTGKDCVGETFAITTMPNCSNSSAIKVTEWLETDTRKIKRSCNVLPDSEMKTMEIKAQFESEKSDSSFVSATFKGDAKESISYSLEDEDVVIVFDSEEEELYSRFTQVEVKKESLTEENKTGSVISSEDQQELMGGDEEDGDLFEDISKQVQKRSWDNAGASTIPTADDDISAYDQPTLVDDYSCFDDNDDDMYLAETQPDVDLLNECNDLHVKKISAKKMCEGLEECTDLESSWSGAASPAGSLQVTDTAKASDHVQMRTVDNSAVHSVSTTNTILNYDQPTLVDNYGFLDSDDNDDVYVTDTQQDDDFLHLHDYSKAKVKSSSTKTTLSKGHEGYSDLERFKRDGTLLVNNAQKVDAAETSKQMQDTAPEKFAADQNRTAAETSLYNQPTLAYESKGVGGGDDDDGDDDARYLAETQVNVGLMHDYHDSDAKSSLTSKAPSKGLADYGESESSKSGIVSLSESAQTANNADDFDDGMDDALCLVATQVDTAPMERPDVQKQMAQKSMPSIESQQMLEQNSKEWLKRAKLKKSSERLKEILSRICGTGVKTKDSVCASSCSIDVTGPKSTNASETAHCNRDTINEGKLKKGTAHRMATVEDLQKLHVSRTQPMTVATGKSCTLFPTPNSSKEEPGTFINIVNADGNRTTVSNDNEKFGSAHDKIYMAETLIADTISMSDLSDTEMNSEDDSALFQAATQIDPQFADNEESFVLAGRRASALPLSHQEASSHHQEEHETVDLCNAEKLDMEEMSENPDNEADELDHHSIYYAATQADPEIQKFVSLEDKSSCEREEMVKGRKLENLQHKIDAQSSTIVIPRQSFSKKSYSCKGDGIQHSDKLMKKADRSLESAVQKMMKQRPLVSRIQEISIQPESRRRGKWRGFKQRLDHSELQKRDTADIEQKQTEVDDRWMSSSKRHFQEGNKSSDWVKTKGFKMPSKRQKKSNSKEDISISTDAAKKTMEERNKRIICDPSSAGTHWRRLSTTTEQPCPDTDVELPNTQEVMEKQYPMLFLSNMSTKNEKKSSNVNSKVVCEKENREKPSETFPKNNSSNSLTSEKSKLPFIKNPPKVSGSERAKSEPSKHDAFSERQKFVKDGQGQLLDSDKDERTFLRKKIRTGSASSSSLSAENQGPPLSSVLDSQSRDDTSQNSRNHSSHIGHTKERHCSGMYREKGHASKDDSVDQSNLSRDRKRRSSQDSKTADSHSTLKQSILKDPHKKKETGSSKTVRMSLSNSQEKSQLLACARSSVKHTASSAALASNPLPASRPPMPAASANLLAENLLQKRSQPLAQPPMWGMASFRASNASVDSSGISRTTKPAQGQLLQSDDLLSKLLSWSPLWLEEYEKSDNGSLQSLPPIVKHSQLYPLVTTYENIFDYQEIFFALLLLEIWEEIFKSWKEKKNKRSICNVCFTSNQRCSNQTCLGFEWKGFISKQQREGRLYPLEGEVVVVDMRGEYINSSKCNPSRNITNAPQLGYVEKISIQPCMQAKDVISSHPALKGDTLCSKTDAFLITIMLKMRYRKFAPSPDHLVKLYSLGPIVNGLRRFEALTHLPRSPLQRDILKPTQSVFRHSYHLRNQPFPQKLQNDSQRKYNEIQTQVIRNIATAIQEPPQMPRVRLLQGPPGTGKSHVIAGTILKILEDSKNVAKICLAAPSNAAADELLLRLVKKKNENGLKFSMVRIGTGENINPAVRGYTLESRINKAKEEEMRRRQLTTIPKSVQMEYERYEKLIRQKKLHIEECKRRKDKKEIDKSVKELDGLKKRQMPLRRIIHNDQKDITLTPEEYYTIRCNVLLQANIVCGTLSSFGSTQIYKVFRDHGNSSNSRHFSCAIIDEATQATELDCLIPLQYGITKLILVGDPHQLPPTVLSKKAQSLHYGLSLFERLYNHFREDYKEESPLLMLRVQYRMDRAICHFPNNHVYSGLLQTDSQIIENCKRFPLHPYLVFDLAEGQEQLSQSGSLSNEAEAELTAELCCQILKLGFKLSAANMGIICPYSSQKRLVCEKLNERGVKQVEVNTVDSFQGREKHIIILSCVRAQSTSGSIGFMADKRRMNVSLTRAKYSLYIIGHLQSLKANEDWKALVQDAEFRKAVVPVTCLVDLPAMIRQHCVKPEFQSKIKSV